MKKKQAAVIAVTISMMILTTGCGNKDTERIAITEESPIPIVEIFEQKLPYEPVSIEHQERNIIKTYIVPKTTDLYELVEDPFIEDERTFRAKEIQKKIVPGDIEKKMVTQTIPVEVPNSNRAEALAWYSPELDYTDEEGFSGRVQLNPDTLLVEPNGTKKYSYQITDSKQFLNLVRNDPSSIPRTATKNGRTLQLVDIDWQVADQAMAGDSLIATRYNAVAHYAANAQGTKVTGYTATAVYTGEASRQGEPKLSCAVIYEGKLTTQGVLKRMIVPVLMLALVLAILLPIILRKRKLQKIKEGANRNVQTEAPALAGNVQRNNEQPFDAQPASQSRFRAWREKKRKEHKPIFVEVIDEDGDQPKAKIYLPKDEEEGETNEGI